MSKSAHAAHDSRGPVGQGLRGIAKDAYAMKMQAARKGNVALLASLRPTDQAMEQARRKVAAGE